MWFVFKKILSKLGITSRYCFILFFLKKKKKKKSGGEGGGGGGGGRPPIPPSPSPPGTYGPVVIKFFMLKLTNKHGEEA